MKGAIGRNASYFNSHRMMRRYAVEACLRDREAWWRRVERSTSVACRK
jgi:hypothetical protein